MEEENKYNNETIKESKQTHTSGKKGLGMGLSALLGNEAEDLKEEGIEVATIPWPDTNKDN